MKTALPAHLRFLMLAVIILSSCITPVLAFYHPEQGRWINRDPIEEQGGNNVCGFVNNTPNNTYDILGLRGPRTKATEGKCDKCGPEIADGLAATMNQVKRKFDALTVAEKTQRCSMGFLFNTWDIAFPAPPSGCGAGACDDTVMVRGKCYDKWKVNYMLFGRISSLCDFWRLTMALMIRRTLPKEHPSECRSMKSTQPNSA